jgi:uncharacterized protein YjiS (DUF1127 family)
MARLMKQPLLIQADSPHLSSEHERGTEMNILDRINQYTTYQRTVRELNRLDNRQLADLGITRGDIRQLARGRAR